MTSLIDLKLLDEVSAEAVAAPRRRRNRNFHAKDDFIAHRLLNAIEPGSYVAPHRHNDATKDETMVVLRGRLGLVEFDDSGAVVRATVLEPGGAVLGCDIPHGTWHSLVALEPGTVFLEAKAGPYTALTADEKATWAPLEGDAEAPTYLEGLTRRFR